MQQVARETWVAFERRLERAQVPAPQRPDYHKWTRFYLDFCHKYGIRPVRPQALGHFSANWRPRTSRRSKDTRPLRPLGYYLAGGWSRVQASRCKTPGAQLPRHPLQAGSARRSRPGQWRPSSDQSRLPRPRRPLPRPAPEAPAQPASRGRFLDGVPLGRRNTATWRELSRSGTTPGKPSLPIASGWGSFRPLFGAGPLTSSAPTRYVAFSRSWRCAMAWPPPPKTRRLG